MAIAENILYAVTQLVKDGNEVFSRNEIRKLLNVNRSDWNASYDPIFQGMRIDQPGSAPDVRIEYKGVFQRIEYGKYILTEDGCELIRKSMQLSWHDAVLNALHRYSNRHNTKIIFRQIFLGEELNQVIQDTQSTGLTPSQTVSRITQELREEGKLSFLDEGKYLLLEDKLEIENEDLPDQAIDIALLENKLKFGEVITSDEQILARQRKGQKRLRELTLKNYNHSCALCDIDDPNLLITSHISRWADDLEARGFLSNTLCLCSFHDVLFENGYISLSDDYSILKRTDVKNNIIHQLLESTIKFKTPKKYQPDRKYLQKHRRRAGFE
jgi:predicted restriction endonuclease